MSKPMGGTELVAERVSSLPDILFRDTEVWHSRVDPSQMDPRKRQVLVTHDMHHDPMYWHLHRGGWQRFDKIVHVSHWQQTLFQLQFGIPESRSTVIRNGIEPFVNGADRSSKQHLTLIYHSTPHRGLDVLADVFDKISADDRSLTLKVFSSFELYAQPGRDAQHAATFDQLRANPQVSYSGTVSNDVIRDELVAADIFAYPSTWPETSCLCLIEAMCAGLACVHPTLAALPETSMGFTRMYDYHEDPAQHAMLFERELRTAIGIRRSGTTPHPALVQSANFVYDWESARGSWMKLLSGLTSD